MILVGWFGIRMAFDRTPPGDTSLDVLLTQPVLKPPPGGTEIGRREFVGNAFNWPFTGTAPPYVAITYASTFTVNQNYSYYYLKFVGQFTWISLSEDPGVKLLRGVGRNPRAGLVLTFSAQPVFYPPGNSWELAAAPAGTVSYVTVYLDGGR